jgi:hypothetical protein
MRKIRIMEHISLDGVIQAPGGPEEDHLQAERTFANRYHGHIGVSRRQR